MAAAAILDFEKNENANDRFIAFLTLENMGIGKKWVSKLYTFQVMSDSVICRNGGCGHL